MTASISSASGNFLFGSASDGPQTWLSIRLLISQLSEAPRYPPVVSLPSCVCVCGSVYRIHGQLDVPACVESFAELLGCHRFVNPPYFSFRVRVILTCAISVAAMKGRLVMNAASNPYQLTSTGFMSKYFTFPPVCDVPQGLGLVPALSLAKPLNSSPIRAENKPFFLYPCYGSSMIHADTCREADESQSLFFFRLVSWSHQASCRLPAASLLPRGAHLEMFQPHCRPELEVFALNAQPTCSARGKLRNTQQGHC